MNLQHLWVAAQDLHQIQPVNVPQGQKVAHEPRALAEKLLTTGCFSKGLAPLRLLML